MNSANSRSTKRIVILGHGAMGTVFGAALQRAGHGVVFLGRTLSDTREMLLQYIDYVERDGTSERIRIDAVRDPSVVADADLVIVLVKTPDTNDVIGRVAPFLCPGTPLITLQNGLHAAVRIQDILGNDHLVIRGITSQAATRTGSLAVEHTGTGPTLIGFDDPRSEATAHWIASLFSEANIPTTVADPIEREIWQKVAVNSAINGLTALCGTNNGAIVADPELRRLALDVANEASQVAISLGIHLRDLEDAVIQTATATAWNRSSMLQDIDAERPTEADAIYGEIQRTARESGVATPRIDALSALIDARSRRTVVKEDTREQHT